MSEEKNIEMYKQSYCHLAETSIEAIQRMVPIFEEGIKVIGDRKELDNILS